MQVILKYICGSEKQKRKKAAKVLEKIQQSLSKDFTICAGYIDTKNLEFDKAEEYANKALSKALLKGNTFIHAQEQKKKRGKFRN